MTHTIKDGQNPGHHVDKSLASRTANAEAIKATVQAGELPEDPGFVKRFAAGGPAMSQAAVVEESRAEGGKLEL